MGGDTGSIIDGRLIGGVSDRTDSPVSGLRADDGSTEAPGRLLSPVLTHRNGGWLNNMSHLSWKTAAAGSDNGGRLLLSSHAGNNSIRCSVFMLLLLLLLLQMCR